MFATEQDVRGVRHAVEPTLSAIPGFVATAIMLPDREHLAASLEVMVRTPEAAAQVYGLRAGLPKPGDSGVTQLLRSIPVQTQVIAAPRA